MSKHLIIIKHLKLPMEIIQDLNTDRYAVIFNTVYEMMSARGYTPFNNTPDKFKKDDWESKYAGILAQDYEHPIEYVNDLSLYFKHPLTKHTVMCYFYIFDTNCSKDDMKYIVSRAAVNKCKSIILVTKTGVTPGAKESFANFSGGGQLFNEDFFTRNITKHQFVPKFDLMTPEQKIKIMEDYSATESQIPAMLIDDPITKFYNYKRGDLIKITRHDGISYRVIV